MRALLGDAEVIANSGDPAVHVGDGALQHPRGAGDSPQLPIEQLPGCWMLQQTWTRSGDAPAPGTATLLRWLQASLTLSRGASSSCTTKGNGWAESLSLRLGQA